MNVKEALDQYAEFAPMAVRDLKGVVRKQVIQVDVLRLAPIIEKALRAAYVRGVSDARYTDIHPGQHDAYTDAQEGVTAGIAAMTEGL